VSAPAPASTKRTLDTDATYLKGVGPKLAEILSKLGIKTVGDVLYHLPRRYEDRRNIPPIRSLRPGDWATVRGKVLGVEGKAAKRMVIIKVPISDGNGTITLTWFNQPWIKKKFEQFSGEILAYGQVKEGAWSLEMHSPEFEVIEEDSKAEEFARIIPVYPLSDGVYQGIVRRAANSAIENYLPYVQDPMPDQLRKKLRLAPLRWALKQIHQPEDDTHRLAARKRLVFDEFFITQLAQASVRAEAQYETGIRFPIEDERSQLWEDIHKMLPFELTKAQRRVIEEIWSDMAAGYPMNRLLQGDVGSGKTAVAACAMLAAVRGGYQAAIMAPTEILAEQHYNSLATLLTPLGIDVVLLVGKQSAKEKKKAYERTADGSAQVAVGTHALIQEGVEFKRLGLVVVDEQHRFGVLQRAALREKGVGNPDVLVMTATPIPRTLTLAVFGDLELSVIDELPPGRRPIKTHWKSLSNRPMVYESVYKLLQEGRQAYFVCPMVGESEKMQAQAAIDLHYRLSNQVYPNLRVGLLHGQMPSKEKEDVMAKFRAHELDILVSTTVIEVGVDVPNASVMVVEDANRFGLSQLHQLRGRVGRGEHQSFCILLSDAGNDEARARMEILSATTDGFKIAEEDLRLRGPGEICGTRQSGNLDFKIADLVQDGKMLEEARQAAIGLIKEDPGLKRPEHALLRDAVRERRSKMTVITAA
jgi:ATP-dependent DNA helicase RecG